MIQEDINYKFGITLMTFKELFIIFGVLVTYFMKGLLNSRNKKNMIFSNYCYLFVITDCQGV